MVVGAGFAGLYAIYKLRKDGHNVLALEAGDGVGGVWYWNCYPGARCDIESLQYSYTFDPELVKEWDWTERYAQQPEILSYARHVARRHDLERHIRFNTRVSSARFDAGANEWHVVTVQDELFACRYLVMATGCLSEGQVPDLPGLHDFKGPIYHTGAWPRGKVDLNGKRVAIIGTGSSGIQTISTVAKEDVQLTVFQRTPNFSVPMRNRPMTQDVLSDWRAKHQAHVRDLYASKSGQLFDINAVPAAEMTAEQRKAALEERWAFGGPSFTRTFTDLLTDETANSYAADFARDKIREIVKDPQTAADLCPTDHPLGTKRICVDLEYFQTYNRPNVKLVNLRREPLERIAENAVVTTAGSYPADVLILATGYDAVTGALLKIDIRGLGGDSLHDAWQEGPRTYLGLMSAGFPNLFMITGPGSPSIAVNVILAIEQHVDWVARCLRDLKACGATRIEAEKTAQDKWVEAVREEADKTLFPKANSFYVGANIPGKPRVFLLYLGGLAAYGEICTRVRDNGYRGFVIENVAARKEAAAAS
ncbi:flavin-containing monooxygenase [Rhizobium aquaticum]|uniref:flavin-containing monooxygenase n=1 Tax=Rhizobium aquaticum TaxID=1549636 RepID=UPI003394859D